MDAGADAGLDAGLDGGADAGQEPTCSIAGATYRAGEWNELDQSVCCNPALEKYAWVPRFVDGGFYAIPSGYSWPVGNIVSVDFDRNGENDLAVTDGLGVTIFLSRNGDLSAQSTYGAGIPPGDPATVVSQDFNGDGFPDLAVGGPTSISVLFNDGTGHFGSPVALPKNSGAYGITAGDFNGDGLVDLAATNLGGVDLFFGLGGGSFSDPQTVSLGGSADNGALVAAEFRGRGILDLAGSHDLGFQVELGLGDGGFQLGGYYEVSYASHRVVAGDLNGDGNMDLAFDEDSYDSSDFNPQAVGVLPGNGDGTFGGIVRYIPGGAGPYDLAIADLNGDGRPDLVALSGGSARVLWGLPDGGLASEVTFSAGLPWGVYLVAPSDLNGDGALDLALLAYWYESYSLQHDAVQVLLNNCPRL